MLSVCNNYVITIALNYNKIKKKYLKKKEKTKQTDTDFSSHQRNWQEFEQNFNSS